MDIKVNLSNFELWGRSSLCAEVTFNDIRLFSWHQTDESLAKGTREFTAIGQFGYEQWFVFSPEGRWVRQMINGVESPEMIVPFDRLFEITEQAVRDTMGDALNLTYHPTGVDGEVAVHLDGKEVLFWGAANDESGGFIVFDADVSNFFQFWSASTHGFSAWNEGDCDGWPDTFDQSFMDRICPLAYRALHNGWIVGGAA
ncbi:hypothetical protein [Sinorhizobium sp. BG8]|uniref:hypothetical protein n=1 Tax=Sinorhizobium sp. BG8 TaxID=2613773 RepID=UPI00193DFF54|nr:hypothetical protein [Sinorhizobium sp. BG8]QRM54734.1 hypothetical protein F3Y30_09400 [Sinorhizobium sp. BG8]